MGGLSPGATTFVIECARRSDLWARLSDLSITRTKFSLVALITIWALTFALLEEIALPLFIMLLSCWAIPGILLLPESPIYLEEDEQNDQATNAYEVS